jgi:hypothetical protein
MSLNVLATICFFACVFYVCVLIKWVRETKRNMTTRTKVDNEGGETCATKRLHIVVSRRTAERHKRITVRLHQQASGLTERLRGSGPGCHECERIAYERIATSLRMSKKG